MLFVEETVLWVWISLHHFLCGLSFSAKYFSPINQMSSMCPGVDSASKNEYQDIPGGKDGRCVRVTTLPPSCAECLEILEP